MAALTYKERSRLRDALILDAALGIIEEHGRNGLQVVDVCRRAGCSNGAFYYRYRNREALLRALHAREVERVMHDAAAMFRSLNVRSGDLPSLMRAVVGQCAKWLERYHVLMSTFMQWGADDAEMGNANEAVIGAIKDSFVATLLARRAEFLHPRPARAAESCFYVVFGAMSEVRGLRPGGAGKHRVRVSWDDLLADLPNMCLAILVAQGRTPQLARQPRGPVRTCRLPGAGPAAL